MLVIPCSFPSVVVASSFRSLLRPLSFRHPQPTISLQASVQCHLQVRFRWLNRKSRDGELSSILLTTDIIRQRENLNADSSAFFGEWLERRTNSCRNQFSEGRFLGPSTFSFINPHLCKLVYPHNTLRIFFSFPTPMPPTRYILPAVSAPPRSSAPFPLWITD